VDPWLIGGALQYTFMLPREEGGRQTARADKVTQAMRLLQWAAQAEAAGWTSRRPGTQAGWPRRCSRATPRMLQGFDIGPRTADEYKKIIAGPYRGLERADGRVRDSTFDKARHE